jgi:hypothetical protein
LEWSLRQVVADNPVSEWERIFSNSNFRENEKLLVEFAKRIGFRVNEKNRILLRVKPGAIRQINHGKIELQPLLALAIAGANSNPNHPIHRLAQNHSGLLAHTLRLKKYRDPIEHGSADKLDVDENTLQMLIETTVPMITSLVPGVAEDLGEVDRVSNDGDINQERLKSNINLEKALGTAFVSSLSGEIKEQLIRAELMLEQFSEDKSIEIIKCYASVMQHALLDAVNDRKLENSNNELMEHALAEIERFQFYSAINKIPKELSTVAKHNLRRATQGVSTTLGAQLLAVFLLGEEKELVQLKTLSPDFVSFMAELIRLRGHGNQQKYNFSRDDMESLKNNVFKEIKIITEVF